MTEPYPYSGQKSVLELVTRTAGRDIRVFAITLRRQKRYESRLRPSIFLDITEVQDLHIERLADEPDVIRACAKCPAEMIRDNRLWYEVSLSSSVAEDIFGENIDLELGETVAWTPDQVVESKVIENLSLTARDIVTRIDGVGYWNQGPRGGPSDSVITGGSAGNNPEGGPGFW